MAFSPDGQRLAVGTNYSPGPRAADDVCAVSIIDVATGAETMKLASGGSRILAIAFSPDGTNLACGTAFGNLRVWRAANGDVQWEERAHQDSVDGLAYSPDGCLLASVGERYDEPYNYDESTLKVWNASRGKIVWADDTLPDCVHTVTFSPDGHLLATPDLSSIRLMDAVTGCDRGRFRDAHEGGIFSLMFSPDSALLVSGGRDQTAALWDVTERAPVHRFSGHADTVHSVAFSPNGSQIASADQQTARTWDVQKGSPLLVLEGRQPSVYQVLYSPTTPLLATRGGLDSIQVCNATTGENPRVIWPPHTSAVPADRG
jgi:WD40 repeat protein